MATRESYFCNFATQLFRTVHDLPHPQWPTLFGRLIGGVGATRASGHAKVWQPLLRMQSHRAGLCRLRDAYGIGILAACECPPPTPPRTHTHTHWALPAHASRPPLSSTTLSATPLPANASAHKYTLPYACTRTHMHHAPLPSPHSCRGLPRGA